MKKALASILILIGWVSICWLCFSFCYLDINPKTWSYEARAMMSTLGFFVGSVISILAYENEDEPK